jgi:hypothetical protein
MMMWNDDPKGFHYVGTSPWRFFWKPLVLTILDVLLVVVAVAMATVFLWQFFMTDSLLVLVRHGFILVVCVLIWFGRRRK